MMGPSRRVLVAAALALVGLALLGGGLWWWSDTQARRVDAAYASVLSQVQQSAARASEARTEAVRQLEAILAQHPSGRLAAEAAWELGNLRWAARDWARARAAWEVVLARTQAPTLRILARLGIAQAWEAEGNTAKALEAYQAGLASLKPGDFQYEEFLLGLARQQERQGKTTEAIETYRRVLKEAPRSQRVADARGRLASLGASP